MLLSCVAHIRGLKARLGDAVGNDERRKSIETILVRHGNGSAHYVIGAIVLFAITLLACAVPASRAVRINPMHSLAEP